MNIVGKNNKLDEYWVGDRMVDLLFCIFQSHLIITTTITNIIFSWIQA